MQRPVGGGGGGGREKEGGGDWRPGVVISSVQRTTCLCLRDAALPPAKDSIRVVKGIMGTLFPVSAL